MPQFSNNPTESQWLQQRRLRVLEHGTRQLVNKIFFRLPDSYIPIFQAMAEDFYLRGKIPAPSIGLLAKYCLIMAGNAWNKDFQLENKENEVDYTQLPRKRWHPHAPALQSTMKLCDWRYAVEAAYDADEEWSLAEAAARQANAEISPEDF